MTTPRKPGSKRQHPPELAMLVNKLVERLNAYRYDDARPIAFSVYQLLLARAERREYGRRSRRDRGTP